MYIYVCIIYLFIFLPYTSSTWGSGLWELQPHLSLGGSNQLSACCSSIIPCWHWVVVTQHTQPHNVLVWFPPPYPPTSQSTLPPAPSIKAFCICALNYFCVCVCGFVCLQTLPLTAGDHPDTKWLTLLPSVRLKLMYALFLPPVEGRTWEKQHDDTD